MVLPGFTQTFRVFLGVIRFYWISLDSTGFYWVVIRVSSSVTLLPCFFHVFSGFHKVLFGCHRLYWFFFQGGSVVFFLVE